MNYRREISWWLHFPWPSGLQMIRRDISWWLHQHWPSHLPKWLDGVLARLAIWLNV